MRQSPNRCASRLRRAAEGRIRDGLSGLCPLPRRWRKGNSLGQLGDGGDDLGTIGPARGKWAMAAARSAALASTQVKDPRQDHGGPLPVKIDSLLQRSPVFQFFLPRIDDLAGVGVAALPHWPSRILWFESAAQILCLTLPESHRYDGSFFTLPSKGKGRQPSHRSSCENFPDCCVICARTGRSLLGRSC